MATSETYTALPTATHKDSGVRHVAKGEYGNPICGENALKLRWDASPMLGEFPEDFGDLPDDCGRCAKTAQEKIEDQITEVESGEYN